MNEQLIIFVGPAPGAEIEWLPADATGQPLGSVQRGSVDAAAAMAGDRRVVVFIPCELLVLTDVTIPGLRGPKLRQAVPFALEDQLAADIESLHFANDRPDADGRVDVAVIERALLDAWLAEFRAAGVLPAAIVPDCLGLPWTEGSVSAAVSGDRVLLRDGAASGFSCEAALVDAMLAARGGRLPDELAVTSYAAIPQGLSHAPVTRLPDGLLPWLAPQAIEPPLNLLQGDYAPRERRRLELGPWRLPVALAAAWLLLAVVAWGAQFVALSVERRTLNAEVQATFSRILPGQPFAQPRAQIERELGTGAATSGELLHMLTVIGDGLAGVRGTQIGALTYRRGGLQLTVTAQRAEQIDQLRDRFSAQGPYNASIESASSRGEQVEGRIQLRAGGR